MNAISIIVDTPHTFEDIVSTINHFTNTDVFINADFDHTDRASIIKPTLIELSPAWGELVPTLCDFHRYYHNAVHMLERHNRGSWYEKVLSFKTSSISKPEFDLFVSAMNNPHCVPEKGFTHGTSLPTINEISLCDFPTMGVLMGLVDHLESFPMDDVEISKSNPVLIKKWHEYVSLKFRSIHA